MMMRMSGVSGDWLGAGVPRGQRRALHHADGRECRL